MAKVKFSRTEETDITSIPITDGQLIYTKSGKCYLDYGTERIEIVSGGDTIPIGFIASFGDTDEESSIMSDWVLCDGRELSRTSYAELFNIIGTKYGEGDGVSTFNVPKIDGRNLVGLDLNDTDFNEVGKTGGSKTHTQTVEELASHQHQQVIDSSYVVPAQGLSGNYAQSNQSGRPTGYSAFKTGPTGNGKPMDIMNPYLVVKFYIKAFKSASSTAQVKNAETNSTEDVYSCNYVNQKVEEISTLSNYSEEEQVVGTWLDGKTLYRKIVNFGAFPNNSSKEVAHNITNLSQVCYFIYTWFDSEDNGWFCGARVDNTTTICKVSVRMDNIMVEGIGYDWSSRTADGHCDIYYTKTS